MHRIQLGNKTCSIRSEWAEVDAGLLLRLMPYIYTAKRDMATAALLPLLSDIPSLTLVQLHPWQYATLAELCQWVWDEPLTIPIIPQVEHGGQVWKLPTEALYDSPFIEYDHLDTFLSSLDAEGPAALDQVIATILRPVGDDGKRVRFDGMALDGLTTKISTLPDDLKAYILLFATGCTRHIRDAFAVLWEEDETTPARDSRYDLGAAEEVDFGWTGAAFGIAEEGTFGSYQEVIFMDCHTVLYYLSWKKQQGRKLRREMKKSSNQ